MTKTKQELPLIYTIGINKPQSIRLAAYGTILVFLAFALFSWLTHHTSDRGFNPLISLVVYILTLALHEAVHGIFFRVFGGNPKYGVGLMYHFFPYAFATSPGEPYTMRQMFVIGMSPFFIICALAVIFAGLVPSLATYASVAFVGNFSGAIGDMWLMRQVWRFRGADKLVFVDLKNGIAVRGTGIKAKTIAAKLKLKDDPNSTSNKFTSVWLTSVAVITLSALILPTILAVLQFSGHILIGPKQFPFFEYIANVHGSSFTFNPVPSIVAGLLFAIFYRLLRKQGVHTSHQAKR